MHNQQKHFLPSWKYARPTSANTSSASLGRRDYLSNLIWLFIASGTLVHEVENWPTVIRYYLSPSNSQFVAIRFRNRDVLLAPRGYIFEAIAGTLLSNTYRFGGAPSVVVDVGASIGDFSLLASRKKETRVYSYEKDSGYCDYLRKNMELNMRHSVRIFQEMADRYTLRSIIEHGEETIDFLKMDCEGCEYDMLLHCAPTVLARVRTIALEIHERPPYTKAGLIDHLKRCGFQVSESETFWRGHYVYASHETTSSDVHTLVEGDQKPR
ncbi:MAG TPA: FkbM family methyltransferase [Candidatus Bathyarchaeia archaeon]|nr:FkbM family methyltransferase [Candidatus Bathyarchaeia archaeon]